MHKRTEEGRLHYNGQSFNLWRRPGLQNAFFACKNAFADQRKALVPGGVSTFSSSHRAVSALRVILQIQFVRYFADNFCQCKKRSMTPDEKLYADCAELVCLRDNGLCSFFVFRKTKIMCVPPKIWYYSVLILFGIIFYVNFATISVTNVVKINFSDIF